MILTQLEREKLKYFIISTDHIRLAYDKNHYIMGITAVMLVKSMLTYKPEEWEGFTRAEFAKVYEVELSNYIRKLIQKHSDVAGYGIDTDTDLEYVGMSARLDINLLHFNFKLTTPIPSYRVQVANQTAREYFESSRVDKIDSEKKGQKLKTKKTTSVRKTKTADNESKRVRTVKAVVVRTPKTVEITDGKLKTKKSTAVRKTKTTEKQVEKLTTKKPTSVRKTRTTNRTTKVVGTRSARKRTVTNRQSSNNET